MTTEAMIYRFCAQTDPGLTRENNEDAVGFDEGTGVAVLADGMGGYNAGEVASSMATSIINSEMSRWLAEAGDDGLSAGHPPGAGNLRRQCQCGHFQGGACQCALLRAWAPPWWSACFGVQTWCSGHIGDSRCYRLRQGQLVQITRDHSLLQEQIDAGLLTPEQAALSINKNLVTRALGVDDAVLLEVHEHAVEPGDVYLMCSDGLSDMVSDAGHCENSADADVAAEQRAKALVDTANAHGGRDNITVLLVQAELGAEKRGLMARLLGK